MRVGQASSTRTFCSEVGFRVFLGCFFLKYLNFSVYHTADSVIFYSFASSNFRVFKHMESIQVCVFANKDAQASRKRLFERIVFVDDSASIDFSILITSLRFLYGGGVIVSFNISTK